MDGFDHTAFFKRLLDTLLLRQPTRTWCGALLGLVLILLNNGLSPLIWPTLARRLYDGPDWHLLFLGIVLMHIKTIWSLAKDKPEFDEDIEAAFKAIEKAKSGGMSQARVNQAYMALCERVVLRVGTQRAESAPRHDALSDD